jgi:hypothetical protein
LNVQRLLQQLLRLGVLTQLCQSIGQVIHRRKGVRMFRPKKLVVSLERAQVSIAPERVAGLRQPRLKTYQDPVLLRLSRVFPVKRNGITVTPRNQCPQANSSVTMGNLFHVP